MTDGMNETASKKRGRPPHPLLTGTRGMLVRYVAPEVYSPRGLLNVAYRQYAMQLLESRPPSWFLDVEACLAGGERGLRGWRPGILVALGKVAWQYGDDLAVALADALAGMPPMNTREAAARVAFTAADIVAQNDAASGAA